MAYYSSTQPIGKIHFSKLEIRDLLISWLAITFAFALVLSTPGFGFGLTAIDWALFPTALLISTLAVASGFILHELGHKFVATKYGAWAEYRMWPYGLVMALMFALIIGIVWASPGAVYISGDVTESQNGKISLAGPFINLCFAAVFFPLTLITTGILKDICFYLYFINAFLAVFNLIPLMPLDGAKVARWNIAIYVIVMVCAIGLVIPGFL